MKNNSLLIVLPVALVALFDMPLAEAGIFYYGTLGAEYNYNAAQYYSDIRPYRSYFPAMEDVLPESRLEQYRTAKDSDTAKDECSESSLDKARDLVGDMVAGWKNGTSTYSNYTTHYSEYEYLCRLWSGDSVRPKLPSHLQLTGEGDFTRYSPTGDQALEHITETSTINSALGARTRHEWMILYPMPTKGEEAIRQVVDAYQEIASTGKFETSDTNTNSLANDFLWALWTNQYSSLETELLALQAKKALAGDSGTYIPELDPDNYVAALHERLTTLARQAKGAVATSRYTLLQPPTITFPGGTPSGELQMNPLIYATVNALLQRASNTCHGVPDGVNQILAPPVECKGSPYYYPYGNLFGGELDSSVYSNYSMPLSSLSMAALNSVYGRAEGNIRICGSNSTATLHELESRLAIAPGLNNRLVLKSKVVADICLVDSHLGKAWSDRLIFDNYHMPERLSQAFDIVVEFIKQSHVPMGKRPTDHTGIVEEWIPDPAIVEAIIAWNYFKLSALRNTHDSLSWSTARRRNLFIGVAEEDFLTTLDDLPRRVNTALSSRTGHSTPQDYVAAMDAWEPQFLSTPAAYVDWLRLAMEEELVGLSEETLYLYMENYPDYRPPVADISGLAWLFPVLSNFLPVKMLMAVDNAQSWMTNPVEQMFSRTTPWARNAASGYMRTHETSIPLSKVHRIYRSRNLLQGENLQHELRLRGPLHLRTTARTTMACTL